MLLLFVFVGSTRVLGQHLEDEKKYLQKIIQTLAHDSLNGREASTEYEQKAAVFIIKQFKDIFKKKPESHIFDYQEEENQAKKKSVNIYYLLDNKADSTIIVSAHYDHLGINSNRTRSYGKTGIHNGADDNASGVALMLSLAKKVKNLKTKKYNFIFVAYSAHENGLFGSRAFYSFLAQEKIPIALVLNFDMVGRFDNKARVLNIYGSNTLHQNQTFFEKPVFDGNIYTNNSEKVYLTDAGIFAEKNIPSLSFTTGIHNDYHKITDDEMYINYEGIVLVQKFIEQFLKVFL